MDVSTIDATESGTPASQPGTRERLETIGHSFPLTWRDAGLFVLAFGVITLIWSGIGALVVGPLDSTIGDTDRSVARRFVDTRTKSLNDVSLVGSWLAETVVKVALTAVVVGVMLWVWRRWREALIVAMALILEASCFLAITLLVGRPRPPVERLDSSPVDSSFPSGHVAAAVVYGAFAIVVFMHTKKVWPRVLAVAASVIAPLIVGWARMYRGMHHLSDVVAGVALGLVCLVVTYRIVERACARHEIERR